ncbi:phenylacetate--CoA ligase family protein [Metabacillus malikii]|uniref:Phenylacetate-CoA ligase n=1 Tax=Metabacillus malikii TaxID=1504265 RepID=A0ABT9ZA01_9BACI|nr:AMP-binding protein [Metabacillus malikii]MDQ0229062.1 phenylacetate-CoA ligase [Metabacillus malikii]
MSTFPGLDLAPSTRRHITFASSFNETLEANGRNFETIQRDEKKSYHLEMLNRLMLHAVENNEFYRKQCEQVLSQTKTITSLDDFANISFLEKEHIYDNLERILCVPRHEIAQFHSTSGTSGKSIYTCLTLNDMYVHEQFAKYEDTLFADITREDVVGISLPYELAQPALGFHRMFQLGFETSVVSLGKGGYMAPPKRTVQSMKDLDVTILITTPSYVSMLIEIAEELGLDVNEDLKVRKMILTGEGCSSTFLSRLKELWDVELEFHYGSTECGLVGIQKDSQPYYTLLEGGNYVEIVDQDTLEPLGDNEIGEIVVTTLLKEGMPFIRYRTGDLGFVQGSDMESGLRKLHLRGRKGSSLFIEGVEYSPIAIEHILLMHKEVGLWYQLVVEDEELTIEIEPRRRDANENYLDALVQSVRSHMFSVGGIPCHITINQHIERQFTKVVRVIKK